MADVAELFVSAVGGMFRGEGSGRPDSAPSPRRPRRGGKILQCRGSPAGNNQASFGAGFAEATTDVPYARFHATGTKHMPQRDFTDVNDAVFDEAAEILLE